MPGNIKVSDYIFTAEKFIGSFYNNLKSIDPDLLSLVEFKSEIQKRNLMSLVEESNARISKYEHIYPYIKEICLDQTIDPIWYKSIEKVLNWALKKGRGKSRNLSKEIKNAWITYIVLLSCSMIDHEHSKKKYPEKHLSEI